MAKYSIPTGREWEEWDMHPHRTFPRSRVPTQEPEPMYHEEPQPEPPRDFIEEGFKHFARQYVSLFVGVGGAWFFGWFVQHNGIEFPGVTYGIALFVVGYIVYRAFRALVYWLFGD